MAGFQDYPQIPMPQMMNLNMPAANFGGGGNQNQEMGMKMLQAALKQPGAVPGAPPAVGAQVGGAGGPMNLVPPAMGGAMQQGSGMGLLAKLFGPGGALGGMGGSGMGGAAAMGGGLGPLI